MIDWVAGSSGRKPDLGVNRRMLRRGA